VHSAQLLSVIENKKFSYEVISPFNRLNGSILGLENSLIKHYWGTKMDTQFPKPYKAICSSFILRLLAAKQQRTARGTIYAMQVQDIGSAKTGGSG
jgi:hypothetical protein